MDDGFHLLAAGELQDYLKGFGDQQRREGHTLFARGHVDQLAALEPGRRFSGIVNDEERFAASLEYGPRGEWSGECGCGERLCRHLFATGSAVMAEHRAAEVQRLSGSLGRRQAGEAGELTALPRVSGESVETQLQAAVGRPLRREELSFLQKLRRVYEKSRAERRLSSWAIHELGLPFGDLHSEVQQLWPSFPQTEMEFWLFLAHAITERGGRIPTLMRPVTDLSVIEDRIQAWRRSKVIQKWKSTLESLQVNPGLGLPSFETESDLRIVVAKAEFRLEWRPPGAEDFLDCAGTTFRRLASDYQNGRLRLTTEGELIWHVFYPSSYDSRITFRYRAREIEHSLVRLLRMPPLQNRFVSPAGVPLARVTEPLRWQLTPPEYPSGDYRLRLVQADGSPPPEFVVVLGSSPAFYLTTAAVFTGPDRPHFFEDEFEVSIPAPAMETGAGVSFLRASKLALPPRIQDRVQVLAYQVSIICELVLPEFGAEECTFVITAEAADGQQLTWNGRMWQKAGRRRASTAPSASDTITVYDASNLAAFPVLLDPLKLKVDYRRKLSARVTRKFPETFGDWLRSLPPHITVELKGELASFMQGDVAGSIKLEVDETEIDWFDLRVVLGVADTNLTPEEIKLLLNAKGKFVRLEGKGWRRLRFTLTGEEEESLARLGLSARELSAEPQRLHALQMADPSASQFLPAHQVEQVRRRLQELKARVTPALPPGITAQLRPYQLEGFHFLAYLTTNRFGGILADDMGLGKTVQTLAWLLWVRQQPLAQEKSPLGREGDLPANPPSLVVCPKSVMDNWHAEAAKFAPSLRVRCWTASELARLPAECESADLHVINYSQLRSIGEQLLGIRWLAAILDEGQYIKNPNSQTALIARGLRTGHRLILTGTPIENRLLDLWSLMAFAMPGVLGNRAAFARLYDAKGDPFARRRLAARVRPFVLRRTKGQVAKDLPDRVEEDLYCEIEGEQQKLYRAELKAAQQRLLGIMTPTELAQQQFHFLTCLLRLRQICCHPRLIKPGAGDASAKTEALLEQLEPLMDEGEKVLVFSQFVTMLDLLRPEIEGRGWPVFYLAGQTENRGELIENFQTVSGPAVFLISLKAGGFGLNLTAANYVILFDPWWNPAVENQAIDRTHRIGQTEKVIAYRLLIKNSIEEKIRELQKRKHALAEDVLGEEKFSQSLTLEDMRFLFAD